MVTSHSWLSLTYLTLALHIQVTVTSSIDDRDIVKGCSKDCGTLVLIDRQGKEIQLQGDMSNVKHKGIVKAKIVGYGCFIIYKSRNYNSDNLRIEGAKVHVLKDLGHNWSTVKSLRYSSNCFTKTAGMSSYLLIPLAGILVLVVTVSIMVNKRKPKHDDEENYRDVEAKEETERQEKSPMV